MEEMLGMSGLDRVDAILFFVFATGHWQIYGDASDAAVPCLTLLATGLNAYRATVF